VGPRHLNLLAASSLSDNGTPRLCMVAAAQQQRRLQCTDRGIIALHLITDRLTDRQTDSHEVPTQYQRGSQQVCSWQCHVSPCPGTLPSTYTHTDYGQQLHMPHTELLPLACTTSKQVPAPPCQQVPQWHRHWSAPQLLAAQHW
jgi:hypothetical protein